MAPLAPAWRDESNRHVDAKASATARRLSVVSNAETPTVTKPLDIRLMGATVRVPEHVVYRPFPAETVVLNLESGTYHGLNRTGGRMLEALDQLGEVKQVAAVLQGEFDQPTARIQADLCRFCQDLIEANVLELVSLR
jgi:hypothetical protein